jgi:hypothetical protein
MIDTIRQLLPAYYARGGYHVLPAVGILLALSAFALSAVPSGAWRVARAAVSTLLVSSALAAIVVYNNFFNYHYGGYVNSYEFFHYFLGSKYAREVGYFDLYGAALAADEATGRLYRPSDGRVTDLRTQRQVPVEELLALADRHRALFDDERWEAWVGDVFHFKKRLGAVAWNRILHDRGYNATPVWTMIAGGLLSGHVSAGDDARLLLLALLDVLLLAAAVAGVAWAFGAWPALLMIVFLASSYLMAHVHMKGAFLRTDFVVSLVLAVCALKRGRPALAGALVAGSTLSRVFPIVFLFGPAVGLVREIVASRSGSRGALDSPVYRRFFVGFLATAAILLTASVVWAGRPGVWSDFAKKMALHRRDPHAWNVGFPNVLAAERDETAQGPLRLSETRLAARMPLLRLVQAAVLVAGVFAVSRLAPHRALAWGFVPLYFLIAPTYYYYIVLLVPFLFFAERLHRPSGVTGVVYLFLFGMAGYAAYQRWEQSFTTYYVSSVLALGVALLMLYAAYRKS